MKKNDNFTLAKAVIAFFVVTVVAGVYLLFQSNKEALMITGSIQGFTTLVIIAFVLLIGLFYLVSNSHAPSPSRATAKKRKRSR